MAGCLTPKNFLQNQQSSSAFFCSAQEQNFQKSHFHHIVLLLQKKLCHVSALFFDLSEPLGIRKLRLWATLISSFCLLMHYDENKSLLRLLLLLLWPLNGLFHSLLRANERFPSHLSKREKAYSSTSSRISRQQQLSKRMNTDV